MSKGSGMMGTMRGKLGDMVFYRAKGEQRTRAYIKTVQNPKTASQMTQRTQLSNLVNLYRISKNLLYKSFQGKRPKQTDYNAFVSANLNAVKVYIPKEMAKVKGCVVAPYQVSSGSLPPIQITGKGINAVTNIVLGNGFGIDATTTIKQFSDAIVANNPAIAYGMQLSYVSMVQQNSVSNGYPFVTTNLFEVTLSETNESLLYDSIPAYGVAAVGGYLGHGEFVTSGGFCWIWSRTDEKGATLVSPQSIIVTSDDLYTAYSSEQARSTATRSYNGQNDPFIKPGGNTPTPGVDPMSISSVLFDGKVLVDGASDAYVLAANGKMVINGTNLVASNLSVTIALRTDMSDSEIIAGKVPLSNVISVDSSSATVINGTDKSGSVTTGYTIAFMNGNTILFKVVYNDVIDPME